MKKYVLFFFPLLALAQKNPNSGYWQQHADYKMEVNMDVKNYQYKGKQTLLYTNNSPDTLKKVYIHLYNNAFQPNSPMDARLKSIKDPDGRMVNKVKVEGKEVKESRISTLKPNEIGYLYVNNLKQDGIAVISKRVSTILEVNLAKPLMPKTSTTFTMDFDGQVPVQIRRSGRNNKEGIELSMSQWYPKIAEYDIDGWQADPYIGREFHGVWGNFDVKITIDKEYTLGGSGYLQNANEVGKGYEENGFKVIYPKKTKNLTWHFIAPQVHDFTWAADKEYLHDKLIRPDGITLHFLYQNKPEIIQNWKNLQPKTSLLMDVYNKTIGQYPYKQYSVIQGGDGGMEYAMCTLILGEGTQEGLIGVTAHEMAHSWFQHILATNESKYSWMDEGFTTWLENYGLNEIAEKKVENPHEDSYKAYFLLVKSGKEQPQTTHADHYDENRPYSIQAYSKGNLFLTQLEYLIGKENLRKVLKRYYADFKFTHPTPTDIIHTAEKITGANLDWYLTEWTKTTNTIDYAIKEVVEEKQSTKVILERLGRMPMPLEITVFYENGTQELYYIPQTAMRWSKPNESNLKRNDLESWDWAYPVYDFVIPSLKQNIKAIVIDAKGEMADIKKENQIYKL
ncbi:M1 family metallopeptidase [Flavobacterium covae]|uniref:M1 family metallopeptidase n=1 Tax=Flavobacterium covae TaxID=2906076 RepID=UPI000745C557|nr:M1 family metallopeptidase [Flavobacterium covae]AMA48141.1 peptidase M1 [Flavobacterium covae]MCJ1809166.1 M1 family metallopeptidase [Flavobacterium covae]